MRNLTDSTCENSTFQGIEPLYSEIILNRGTDEELVCKGYRRSRVKIIGFYLLVILSLGLLLLLLYWKPELECYLKRTKCPLYKADAVLLKDNFGYLYVSYIATVHLTEPISDITFQRRDFHTQSSSSEDERSAIVVDLLIHVKYFDHHHVRYIWDHSLSAYKKLCDLSSNTKCTAIQEDFHGLSSLLQNEKLKIHGHNVIDVKVKSYFKLFFEEVLNPFYIFQLGSIILWSCDEYYSYASCIFVISTVSLAVSLYQIKKQSKQLHDMVSSPPSSILVCKDDKDFEETPQERLVPGDVIAIPSHGCILSCDAVLITGTCIVNESMLTGESVPVTKTTLSAQEDGELYNPEKHKRHTVFAGTQVLQTRYYGQAKVLAVVVRTGFNTAKGDLVRGILFPKPLGFKFYQDAMKFILFLACIAALGMSYCIYVLIKINTMPGSLSALLKKNQAYTSKIVLRTLDIITIVVPPALPVAMTIGTVYAQGRLKKKGIFCISPPRINFCGRINLFCFDKTGTLTEDGLDMWGIVPVHCNSFQHPVTDVKRIPRGPVINCMASCHSLTNINGDIVGDPLDLIMFNSINWTLDEPGQDTSRFDTIMPTVVKPCNRQHYLDENVFEIGIVRQFTFSSSMQRMSVITRTLGDPHMEVYCKGAPETIAALCDPETVPAEFNDILHRYTVQGLRVIALSWKPLDSKITWHHIQRISRDKVEHDLKFLGLLIMENKLKEETKPAISVLKEANIRPVMITGDMLHTAISVARNCAIINTKDQVVIVDAEAPSEGKSAKITWKLAEMPITSEEEDTSAEEETTPFIQHVSLEQSDSKVYHAIGIDSDLSALHFAVNGRSLSVITKHFPDVLSKISVKGSVFARMSPDQKCQLIQTYQDLGYIVGMCGDGANDCEALKAAHAGISLSEAEASVAAPFTSRVSNINCVIKVIREGRAALVTSFSCFKYMALYSLIQFVTVLILYDYTANLGDNQFLYIDLLITTSIAVFMGYTSAYSKLAPHRPPGSLIKLSNLLSIIYQVVLMTVIQIGAFTYLRKQKWYYPVKPSRDVDNVDCWESTVMFLVSSFLYASVAFAFSSGPPFRKPIYTNVPYIVDLLVIVVLCVLLTVIPMDGISTFLKIKEGHYTFRRMLLLFPGVHFITSALGEACIMSRTMKSVWKKCRRKKVSKNKYKEITQEIESSDWPPIGQITWSRPMTDEQEELERSLILN